MTQETTPFTEDEKIGLERWIEGVYTVLGTKGVTWMKGKIGDIEVIVAGEVKDEDQYQPWFIVTTNAVVDGLLTPPAAAEVISVSDDPETIGDG